MITPVIVWTAIIGIFMAAIIIRFIVETARRFHEKRFHCIFSLGSEREEFYVPGDPIEKEDALYEDD